MTISEHNPGTSAATAHIDQDSSKLPCVPLAIRLTISGLGAVAVINIAEVIGLIL
ncbi:hypothetical protein D3C72_2580760 [compost metagenome]